MPLLLVNYGIMVQFMDMFSSTISMCFYKMLELSAKKAALLTDFLHFFLATNGGLDVFIF